MFGKFLKKKPKPEEVLLNCYNKPNCNVEDSMCLYGDLKGKVCEGTGLFY